MAVDVNSSISRLLDIIHLPSDIEHVRLVFMLQDSDMDNVIGLLLSLL